MSKKTQNHFLKFSIHLSVRQIYGTSKASLWRNLSTDTLAKILGQSFALQLQFTIDIFFRTAVLQNLFDIGFSYKYCNFSHVCLLVKMASKTATRSIARKTTPVFAYLDYKKILTFYAYRYFETESLYSWKFQSDFLMQHQLSLHSHQ